MIKEITISILAIITIGSLLAFVYNYLKLGGDDHSLRKFAIRNLIIFAITAIIFGVLFFIQTINPGVLVIYN